MTSADDDFELAVRDLLDRVTTSVWAPADLAARVRVAEERRERRRTALATCAVAVITFAVTVGAVLLVGRMGGSSTTAFSPVGPPGSVSASSGRPSQVPTREQQHWPPPTTTPFDSGSLAAPLGSGEPADEATAAEINEAFDQAFDADDDIDDGLAYVQDGEQYHAMTEQFGQRYPGVTGNLRVDVEDIKLIDPDHASGEIVITHSDPTLGAKWGYTITWNVSAVRLDGRWLVASDTYAFLVGTA